MNYEVHLVKGSMLVLILIIMFLLVTHIYAVYMFLVQLILVCGGLIGEGFANNDMSLVSRNASFCVKI